MAHDRWLGKRVILLHVLKPLRQNTLVATVSFIAMLFTVEKIPSLLETVLDEIVKISNVIKLRHLNSRLSISLCDEICRAAAANGGSMFITRKSFGSCIHTALRNFVFQC
jgi:hypothetical protein